MKYTLLLDNRQADVMHVSRDERSSPLSTVICQEIYTNLQFKYTYILKLGQNGIERIAPSRCSNSSIIEIFRALIYFPGRNCVSKRAADISLCLFG